MKKIAKDLVILVILLVLVFATGLGCASVNQWGTIKEAEKVKVETESQSDELLAKELPKKAISIDVVKSPNADQSLSDEMMGEMTKNCVDQFTKDGWAVFKEALLKLRVEMSLCENDRVVGRAVFEREDKPLVTFRVDLVRSKHSMQLNSLTSTTYVTFKQLRDVFAQVLVQAINKRAKFAQGTNQK